MTPNQSELFSSKAVRFCHGTPLDAKSPSSNSPILNLAILVAKSNFLTCSLLNTPKKKILKKLLTPYGLRPFILSCGITCHIHIWVQHYRFVSSSAIAIYKCCDNGPRRPAYQLPKSNNLIDGMFPDRELTISN